MTQSSLPSTADSFKQSSGKCYRSSFSFSATSLPFALVPTSGSEENLEALTQSELSAVIPVLFVIHHREQKSDLAEELEAVAAIDDQTEVVSKYRRAGIFAIQVGRNFGLASHKDEIIRHLCDQAGVEPDRDVRPKGVLTARVWS